MQKSHGQEKPLSSRQDRTKRPYFDVNKKKLKCFLQKEDPTAIRSDSAHSDKHEPIGTTPEQTRRHRRDRKRNRLEDSPDLALQVANDVIKRIQKEGIQTNWSENERSQEKPKGPESPLQNSFSLNNIWRSDWGTNSISKSLYSTQHTYSCNSLPKHSPVQLEVHTHRSSLNFSFDAYQPQHPFSSISSPSSYYDHRNFQTQTQPNNDYGIYYQEITRDGRTTVMIKNIPNKYSLATLSDEIDLSHTALYDFLYLPFDYNSKCNMGYAFINFLSAGDLLTFYEAFNNRKWLKFRSEKICALTYARLQGKSDLIEHFHSSKVLNQKGKCYRPIIRTLQDIKDIVAKQKQVSTQK